MSLCQASIPDRLLGRANASMDFLARGGGPIGALVGGELGARIGIRPTLFVSAVGPVMAVLCLYFSPIRRLRALPVREAVDASMP